MNGRIQRCHCGHDLSNHHKDPTTGGRHDCLAMGCDCGCYVDENVKTSPKALIKQRPPRVIYDDPNYASKAEPKGIIVTTVNGVPWAIPVP